MIWLDMISNEQIRTRQQKEVTQITIERKQLEWCRHLIIMPENRQGKLLWNEERENIKKEDHQNRIEQYPGNSLQEQHWMARNEINYKG